MFVVTLVFLSGIAGLVWAIYNYKKLGEIECRMASGRSQQEVKLLEHYDPVSIGAII